LPPSLFLSACLGHSAVITGAIFKVVPSGGQTYQNLSFVCCSELANVKTGRPMAYAAVYLRLTLLILQQQFHGSSEPAAGNRRDCSPVFNGLWFPESKILLKINILYVQAYINNINFLKYFRSWEP
jgi:hypothetical protein